MSVVNISYERAEIKANRSVTIMSDSRAKELCEPIEEGEAGPREQRRRSDLLLDGIDHTS